MWLYLQILHDWLLGLPRVLEYSSSKLIVYFFTTALLVTFYFRLQISSSGYSFLQSIDELLKFMETWRFAISFAIPAWK